METSNKIRVVPYASGIYKLSRIFCKFNRVISGKEYQNCLNDCVVFKGADCFNEVLDHALSFKGELEKVNNKIVEFDLFLLAHLGSDLDSYSYVVLNNLPQWRTVVNFIKNGAGIESIKIFND